MKILFVHHGKGIGGAPLSLLYLIRGLDRARFEPTVLCLHESDAADLYRKEGIETIVREDIRDFSHTNVLWYPWWQLPKIISRAVHLPFAIDRAEKFLQKRSFDIVHLNTSTLLAFGIAAHRCGVKVVWHVREPIARGYFGLRRAFVRRIVDGNADRIIPICKYDAGQLIPSPKITVVYNFVDFTQFDAGVSGTSVQRELGLERRRMVLMLGGVNEIKGTLVFVRAARKVLNMRNDVSFVIAGPIPDANIRNRMNGSFSYLRRIKREIPKELASSILLLGVRTDVPTLIAASDVLCFPSTVPHFARPVIEASAMGKPVIASKLGGPEELVRDGLTGLLVQPSDPAALAEAITKVLSDGEAAARMGREGYLFARENFDSVKNTERVLRIYEELTAEK